MAHDIERRLAVYMGEVFRADVDMQSDAAVGQFLHSCMGNTKYRSIRGEQRNIKLLHTGFVEFYRELSGNWFTELWQVQKVLTGDRVNFYEICLLALLLDVPMRDVGLSYPEIADRLHAPYDTVESIGEHRYGTYHKVTKIPLKSGAKPQDWEQIDVATLPLLKDAIRQLQGDGTTRPKRVTVFAVESMLPLSSKRIALHLSRCLAEIRRYKETHEQYWTREVVWAVNVLRDRGDPLTWRRMRALTNMRLENFKACLPKIQLSCM